MFGSVRHVLIHTKTTKIVATSNSWAENMPKCFFCTTDPAVGAYSVSVAGFSGLLRCGTQGKEKQGGNEKKGRKERKGSGEKNRSEV